MRLWLAFDVFLFGFVVIGGSACRDEVPVYGADPFVRDPAPIGSLAGKILTTNFADDTLSVLDPALPVRRVPLPGGAPGTTGCQRCPYAVAVAPDGSAWVSSLGPNNGSAGRGSVDVFVPGPEGNTGGAFQPDRQLLLSGRPIFSAFSPLPDVPGSYLAYVPEQAGPGDRLHVLRVDGPACSGT